MCQRWLGTASLLGGCRGHCKASRNVSRRLQILQGKLLVSAEHTDLRKSESCRRRGRKGEKIARMLNPIWNHWRPPPPIPLSFSRLSGWLGVPVLSGSHCIIFFAKEPQWWATKDGVPMPEKSRLRSKGCGGGATSETIPKSGEGDQTLTLPLKVHPHLALRINPPTLLPILGRKAFIRTTQVPLPSKASRGWSLHLLWRQWLLGKRGRHDRHLEGPGCDSQEVNVCYHGSHQGEKLWNILKMQVHKLLMPGAAVAL